LNDVQLNYVLTDTLFISVDKRVSKRFFLYVDSLKLFLEKDFELVTPITLSQDSVTLTGPESLLNALSDTITILVDEKGIDEGYSEEVPILIPQQEIITRDPPTVTVSFDVGEYLAEEQSIPLSIENVPEKKVVTLQDSLVRIKYRKPENIHYVIPTDSFKAVMDFKTLNKADTSMYPVLIYSPKILLEVQIDTSRVKVFLHE
ncbi:MAG: YbbR-like domain-containing protein, partial [Cyclobacteriaceae bacterium]|nr:YbbR-like domain-containing protein [Cyclobacteriaceae bacterium]